MNAYIEKTIGRAPGDRANKGEPVSETIKEFLLRAEGLEARVAELEDLCRDVEGYIEPCPEELRERLRAVNRASDRQGKRQPAAEGGPPA